MRRPFSAAATQTASEAIAVATAAEEPRGWWPGAAGQSVSERHLARLLAPAQLYVETQPGAEPVMELPEGEFLEAFGSVSEAKADVGNQSAATEDSEWVLVRAPLEDEIEIMSEKPLLYQDGWVRRPQLERAPHQMGDRIAARVDAQVHPVLLISRKLPWWRDTPLPPWVTESVSELHTGRIGGVLKRGRYMVQRPSGAIPERLAVEPKLLWTPRQRAKRTAIAALVGLGISACLGSAVHGYAWLRGEPIIGGRVAWPKLVGWLTLIVVFVTPLSIGPCFGFANSQLSTVTVVAWLNLLLYTDLFGE